MYRGEIVNMSAGLYIHADSRLAVLLSTFFTSALTHGHTPDAFMQSILVPVIKNKYGDSNDVNNYRPIALNPAKRFTKLELYPKFKYS